MTERSSAAAWSAVSPSSPARAAASAWPPRAGSPPRAPTSSCVDIDEAGGQGGRRGGRRRCSSQVDVTDRERGRRRCSRRRTTPTAASTSPSTTPASPRRTTTRSSTPASTPGSGCRRSTSPRVYLCCKSRHPATCGARARARSSTPRRSWRVMGAATSQISYTASQGRRAGDDPRAGRAVRPRGHPGQRAVPGPGQHPAAAGAVRQGPGAGRRAAWCTSRWAGSPRPRRSPPRWRSWPATTPRFITAVAVPGRRRHLRRVRHPAVAARTVRHRLRAACRTSLISPDIQGRQEHSSVFSLVCGSGSVGWGVPRQPGGTCPV